MKRIKQVLLLNFCVLALVFFSCKKAQGNLIVDSGTLTKRTTEWIENQKLKVKNVKDKNSIDLLIQNLEFKNAIITKRDEYFDLFVIPIKEDLATKKKLHKNAILNLILVIDKEQQIKTGYIVYFIPDHEKKQNSLPENVFSDVFQKKPISVEGKFRYLGINGTILFQLHYKKGNYFYGTLKNGNQKTSSNNLSTNSTIEKKSFFVDDGSNCIDWYLVTTYIDPGGIVYEDWEFIGTSCATNCNEYQLPCNGGSGGGGSGGETQQIFHENVFETSSFQHEIEIGQTPDGSTSDVVAFGSFNYVYQATIYRELESRFIIDIFMYPATISNANVNAIDIYGRTATRIVTLYDNITFSSISYDGKYANLNWRHMVFCRWLWPSIPYEAPSQSWQESKSARR